MEQVEESITVGRVDGINVRAENPGFYEVGNSSVCIDWHESHDFQNTENTTLMTPKQARSIAQMLTMAADWIDGYAERETANADNIECDRVFIESIKSKAA